MTGSVYTESERVKLSFAGRLTRMDREELRGELPVGACFVVAAMAFVLLAGPGVGWGAGWDASVGLGESPPSMVGVAALYVLAIAAVGHVKFDIGAGYTVPTQVVFVPMLFALPLSLVPLLVAAGLALGMVPEILAGRIPASRVLTVPSNSWFALGPAVVLALAGDHSPDGRLGVLMAALVAQFGCDFLANAARERLRQGISVRELAGEVRQVYLIDLAFAPLGLVVALAAVDRPWAVLLVAPLFGVLRWFSKERHARLEQLVELNDAYRGTALVLGDVVEADDTYTGEHCKDVVGLALDVAGQLGLDVDRRRNVEFGALLHDVGKIAVPKEIVNKPGKLDEREFEIIKTHTVEGQRMLERVGGFMGEVGHIVRSHHERFDGAGYPDGLSGQDIPLESRIVSCCDAFNAMTTTRSYRKAMSIAAAVTELRRHSGSQFDPEVVDALIAVVGEG